jgi:tripartite-type tricarboxylate transporter receptor subunit TctC
MNETLAPCHQRRTAAAFLLLAACSIGSAQAQTTAAQDWPTKSVTIVVPFPPGGTTDLVARTLAETLSKSLGQPVVVESKPGAGTTLGADYVAKSRPDGYTLLMGAVHHTIAPSVYKKLPYDFQKDLVPITTVAMVPNVLSVNAAQTPAKNVAELVALAKAAPGTLSYGSNGNGTAQHLIGTLFQLQTGTQLMHIPYKGSADAANAVAAGQVLMTLVDSGPAAGPIKGGLLRGLAVTSSKRMAALPEIPTMAEQGIDLQITLWSGLLAPAGTPAAIVNKLQAEVARIVRLPDVRERMAQLGIEAEGGTAEEFAKVIASEIPMWSALAKANNIKAD